MALDWPGNCAIDDEAEPALESNRITRNLLPVARLQTNSGIPQVVALGARVGRVL